MRNYTVVIAPSQVHELFVHLLILGVDWMHLPYKICLKTQMQKAAEEWHFISKNLFIGSMKAMAQKLSILLAVMLAFILCAGLANAAIPVKPGEKIQNAIDAADPGDTIIVESGTYIESLMVNKSIILRGIDTGSGIPLIESEDGPAITLKADGITIEGFWARSVSSWKEDAGILIQSNDNVIKNNLVKGNGNAGMVLNRCINNSISGNIVQGNGNEGIYLKNSSRNRLEGNRIMENGYGLKLEDSHT